MGRKRRGGEGRIGPVQILLLLMVLGGPPGCAKLRRIFVTEAGGLVLELPPQWEVLVSTLLSLTVSSPPLPPAAPALLTHKLLIMWGLSQSKSVHSKFSVFNSNTNCLTHPHKFCLTCAIFSGPFDFVKHLASDFGFPY